MFLGTTAYLIGLLSVIVPIAIHLWSKKTRKTISFGTIRFLTEDDTQAIKSLIPTEWLLLFLRVMMLVIFLLIMSEPFWKMNKETSGLVLIDPAYQTHSNFEFLKDSLQEEKEVLWFSQGFPSINDSIYKSSVFHWELLFDLEEKFSESVTIISPKRMAQFVGNRPVSSNVNWVSLPQEGQQWRVGEFMTGGQPMIISATTEEHFTYFTHEQKDGATLDSLSVTVSIQSDQAYTDLAEFIQLSIEAINADSPLRIQMVDDTQAEWLIWLKNEPAPEQRKLIFATNKPDQQLLRKVSMDIYAIAVFGLENFLAYNFPIQLEQVLGKEKVDIASFDWRSLSDDQIPASSAKANSVPVEMTSSLSHWFWGLLLLILVAERYLSLKTRAAE
ncbi:MAG: BatA domain-containing protein [Cytophagales bacterium]|nr:BatA domain-containing protein [Cytophagales bacterium]